MNWQNVRDKYPNQWVLLEAIEAETIENERVLKTIAVLNFYENSEDAMNEYKHEHKKNPTRELYVYHTQNEQIRIKERTWMGVRSK